MNQAAILDNAIKTLQFLRLKLPPNLHEPCAEMPDTCTLCGASRKLDGVTQDLAFLSEYMSWRGGAGCGDHGEVKAAKKADARVRKVRKALGYTYP